MADIRHRIGIDAPIDRVYETLSTTDGLKGWWTSDVEGDASVGSKLGFFFGSRERGATMEVTDSVPGERVAWRCVAGPEEWVGTTLTFDLKTAADETVVLFSHAGWREPVEFMHHCSTKWGYFLLTMKEGLEGGTMSPFPDDLKISNWG